jgi:parallel beta-helix repeat protein
MLDDVDLNLIKNIMKNKKLTPSFILVYCAAALVWLAASGAQAQPPPCDLQIKACGCVITTSAPDVYEAANNLTASQTDQPNCIEIAAPRAILNLKGMRVIGNGSGIGILIRRKAHHVIVEGGDEAQESNPQAVVSQWDVGLQDEADDAVIELFRTFGGEHLLPDGVSPGNTTGGVLMKGVWRTVLGDARAQLNGKFGVKLTGSAEKGQGSKNTSDITIFNITTNENMDSGVIVDSASNNFLGQGTSSGNANYGFLLRSSPDNLVVNNALSGNKKVGVLLGNGHASSDNFVVGSEVSGSEMGGIEIDKVNRTNIVTVNRNSGNGKFDMIDNNPHCDDNRWYNNMGTGNQACIQ